MERILERILHPNGRRARMRPTFRNFIREKSRVQVRDVTLDAYEADRGEIDGYRSDRPWNVETALYLESRLKEKHPKPNTQQRKITSLNWMLRWNEVDYQAKRPPKQYNENPREIDDAKEYVPNLAKIKDPAERLAVQICADTGWGGSDVTTIRREDVLDSGSYLRILKSRQKTSVRGAAILAKGTADELRSYLAAKPELDYIFPGEGGRPHRHRTWLNAVLKKYGFPFSPRACRSTLASRWDGASIKELMTQGLWSSETTIYRNYRRNKIERQLKSFEAATGRAATDRGPDDDVPGYG